MTDPEKTRILLVDDMPENLLVLIESFTVRGFEVAVAQSGEETFEIIPLFQPDIVLLDVMMPGMDGFEICRQLKHNHETKEIPVIFMTALSDTTSIIKAFDVGGVDYVTKPLHQVVFQYEPVAAAFNYALTAQRAENILIFDFGGGTFDVTVVRVDQGRSEVLALGGTPVGGSDFDRAIMHEKITPLFGRGLEVDGLPVSNRPYIELLNWQSIRQLNRDRQFLKILDDWIFYADASAPFTALKRLIKENHGFAIFREIERAKKALSVTPQATVTYKVPEVFDGEGKIMIEQPITRQEFQELLISFSNKVFRAIDATLQDASLTYQDIDRVIRVGGSSKIPFFYQKLLQAFGEQKLLMKDEFKNVSAGLAVEAFGDHAICTV